MVFNVFSRGPTVNETFPIGEGGIRTLGSLLGYGALAKRCFRPLSHLTKICSHGTRHLPSLQASAWQAGAWLQTRVENIAKNCGFPMCNLGLPTPTSSRARDFIGVANFDCQLIRFGVISEEEARRRILETVSPLDEREVQVAGALDCFAAEDYFARLPLPAFDNSAMDGYAV